MTNKKLHCIMYAIHCNNFHSLTLNFQNSIHIKSVLSFSSSCYFLVTNQVLQKLKSSLHQRLHSNRRRFCSINRMVHTIIITHDDAGIGPLASSPLPAHPAHIPRQEDYPRGVNLLLRLIQFRPESSVSISGQIKSKYL